VTSSSWLVSGGTPSSNLTPARFETVTGSFVASAILPKEQIPENWAGARGPCLIPTAFAEEFSPDPQGLSPPATTSSQSGAQVDSRSMKGGPRWNGRTFGKTARASDGLI